MARAAHQTNWHRLLAALSDEQRERFDQLSRRALKRHLQSTRPDVVVPPHVRAEAVGTYRRRYMKTSSKAARKRMSYDRLSHNPEYLALERAVFERYLARHPPEDVEEVDIDALSTVEVCERIAQGGYVAVDDALAQMVREAYESSGEKADIAQDVCEDLMRFVRDAARTQDLSTSVTVFGADIDDGGRYHVQPFHVQDLTTTAEIAARVRDARLVWNVLKQVYGKLDLATMVEQLMAGRLERQSDIRAMTDLLGALYGKELPPRLAKTSALHAEARRVARYLQGKEFSRILAEDLLKNPRYRRQFDRAVEIKLRVRDNVPETPMEAYPLARTMRRHFVLHVEPTNSGKTHDSLQALMAADSGAYLGPLRLLAYEQFDRMNRAGCPCTLRTGEELIEVAGARHVSSTVEMADFHRPIEVAIVDEAQMVDDADRGYHWTAAILGIPAREVHVCCAPHAAQVVRELIELCGDECETHQHERLVPLRADKGTFRLPGDVRPGDALIVFSRRAVHAVAAQVAACGLRPSLVYGALPHDVRHEEARRFDAGETDVVVATDAIGMGMNLPIRRIVFVEQEKYDGHEVRMLKAQEVQQIAGRAGRYGRYDVGLYQSTQSRQRIRELYQQEVPRIRRIPVGIPDDIALVRGATLTEAILQWMTIVQPKPFVRIDVTRDLMLIGEVERQLEPERRTDLPTKRLALALATMAFDERDLLLRRAWRAMVRAELAGAVAELAVPDAPQAGERLADLEEDYRYCDLLYTYARTFDHPEQKDLLAERRTQISRTIMDLLASSTR